MRGSHPESQGREVARRRPNRDSPLRRNPSPWTTSTGPNRPPLYRGHVDHAVILRLRAGSNHILEGCLSLHVAE